MGQAGKVKDARPVPDEACNAGVLEPSKTADVGSTAATALAYDLRTGWHALQRLAGPMASTQRKSEQKPSVLQSRAGRCGQNWLSWRHGSWTMDI